MRMKTIDLNCDMGEIAADIDNGAQELLMPHITSANIACGGHAGDESTMRATVEQAQRWRVAIGAHPGYPDRANFGRLELDLPLEAVADCVYRQIATLAAVAKRCGATLAHVKPHGALYNLAARDGALARAIADGAARFSRRVVLVGLAGSPMVDAFRRAGFRTAAEAFADRRYEPDGSLRSRRLPDALITDPETAARQALSIAREGKVIASDGSEIPIAADTICIHGDTPGAAKIAEAVARTLREAGLRLRPLG
ncbi:MAG TPA: 5-oxoprolinase subunit PxpA [Bryobacteraceae bacterium]|jgi:UPF0271 protein|nr:5-oxoprolinase subunit PxpA [Bryobacteraceae bacterium]